MFLYNSNNKISITHTLKGEVWSRSLLPQIQHSLSRFINSPSAFRDYFWGGDK